MSGKKTFLFGRFKLIPSSRILLKDDKPVEIGGRAFDALTLFAERPGEFFTKRQLIDHIWPHTTVDEGSLRFQIAALRRILDEKGGELRHIATVTGRGYALTVPVLARIDEPPVLICLDQSPTISSRAPLRPETLIGRQTEEATISQELLVSRFVTVCGPGGVGKTTLALAVANGYGRSGDGVIFVDLGTLSDPEMVSVQTASVLGISVQAADPTPNLISYLQSRKMLLILDSCEHVIDAAAKLAEVIFQSAPDVSVLATSREPLRAKGERVYRLEPLTTPPETASSQEVLRYPSARLFVERALSSGARFDLTDVNLQTVAQICRRLDGVALALELAASRVEAYGLEKTAILLDERLSFLWPGKRTAPPRQKTLQATMNWSFELLDDVGRTVLRRLAVFVGDFSLEAASFVISASNVDRSAFLTALDSLVAKSLIATKLHARTMYYRLLDTTRAYLLEIEIDIQENRSTSLRHASFYRSWLDRMVAKWEDHDPIADRATMLGGLANVRAALVWSLQGGYDVDAGVALAASAVPVFLAASLLSECLYWSTLALANLGVSVGSPDEMRLRSALGQSLMFTQGNTTLAREALNQSLEIARTLGAPLEQLKLLGPLYAFHLRIGEFRAAIGYAEQSTLLAEESHLAGGAALAKSIAGIARHLTGDLAGANQRLAGSLAGSIQSHRSSVIQFGFDHYNWAAGAFARTLWQLGLPDQALSVAYRAIDSASQINHPLTLAFVLNWAVTVFIWTGDLDGAEHHIKWMKDHAETHCLGPYLALARGFRGEVQLKRGRHPEAVKDISYCLRGLSSARYEVLTTGFRLSLAEALTANGSASQAITVIDDALSKIKSRGDVSYLPEALRVRGMALHATGEAPLSEVRKVIEGAISVSRDHGALSWSLRAAIDLARFGDVRALEGVYSRFGEGFATSDLKAAASLLPR